MTRLTVMLLALAFTTGTGCDAPKVAEKPREPEAKGGAATTGPAPSKAAPTVSATSPDPPTPNPGEPPVESPGPGVGEELRLAGNAPEFDPLTDVPAAFGRGQFSGTIETLKEAAGKLRPTLSDVAAVKALLAAVEDEAEAAADLEDAGAKMGYAKNSWRVVAVALTGDQTAKCLPLLKRLPYLAYLDLSGVEPGSLTDPDLGVVAELPRLEYLDLSGQLVSEDGVSRLAPLARLRGLVLTGTRLTDRGLGLACRSFPRLERLSVAGTKVTARGAEHLPTLAGLRELDLRDLPLETESLAHVGKLTRLEVLRLPDVKGVRDGVRRGDLAVFTQVGYRPVPVDGLTGPGPDDFAPPARDRRLPTPDRLDYVRGLKHLSGLTSLRDVRMLKVFRTSDPRAVREWAGLPLFTFRETQRKHLKGVRRGPDGRITPFIPFHSSGGFTDQEKEILGRVVNRPSAGALEHVRGLKCVTSLDLSDFAVRDEHLAHVAPHAGLTSLDLSGSPVTAKGLSHLSGLKQLKHLNLRGAAIADKDLEVLLPLEGLADVCLSQTRVTDEGVRWLEDRLPRVKVIFDPKEERPWWLDVDWEALAEKN